MPTSLFLACLLLLCVTYAVAADFYKVLGGQQAQLRRHMLLVYLFSNNV